MSWNQNYVAGGLGTVSTYAPAAGAAFVSVKAQVPTITNGGGSSSLVITIQQNGSTIYTGIAGAEGAYVATNCALNDTLAVILSSSNPNDIGPNQIKAEIAVGSGQ